MGNDEQIQGVPASPSGSRPSDGAAEGVSTLRASIPNADGWIYTKGRQPAERLMGHAAWLLGRYGDIYGPMPLEMIAADAWAGNMFGAAHDLVAFAPCEAPWRGIFPFQQPSAQGTEARRAETENTGSVHDGPVGEADAPNLQSRTYRDGVENAAKVADAWIAGSQLRRATAKCIAAAIRSLASLPPSPMPGREEIARAVGEGIDIADPMVGNVIEQNDLLSAADSILSLFNRALK